MDEIVRNLEKAEPRDCPFCKADLRGEPIPKHLRKMYGTTHYSRLIGIEIPELYDGVSYWECPECHVRWDRWIGRKVKGKKL